MSSSKGFLERLYNMDGLNGPLLAICFNRSKKGNGD